MDSLMRDLETAAKGLDDAIESEFANVNALYEG
jgi:hypothetical protein